MKYLLTFILIAGNIFQLHAQVNILRYDDDFSYLQNDSARKRGLEKLKYIPLYGKATLSFGGEIREQLQYYRNINFGDIPPTYKVSSTGQLLQRIMLHSNILFNENSRLFLQVGSTSRYINPNPAAPQIDKNTLNLHQAFAEFRLHKRWAARFGRQEAAYGSHRVITFREGPNTRLTFDGARVRFTGKKINADAVFLSPVISKPGVFDDHSFTKYLAGIYLTHNTPKKGLDHYIFIYRQPKGKPGIMGQNRFITGSRFFSSRSHIDIDLEMTSQFGRQGNKTIRAFSFVADISHIFRKGRIVTGLYGNYVTGDKDPRDREVNTYHVLFSKPQYGLTVPLGASNIITVNPYTRLKTRKRVSILLGTNFLWRQSSMDGLYTPGGEVWRALSPESGTSSKWIGQLVILETNYMLTKHVSFAVDASRFFAGSYIRSTGKGRDISYLSFKSTFRF